MRRRILIASLLFAFLANLILPALAVADDTYLPIVVNGEEPVYGPIAGRYQALKGGEWLQIFCVGPVTVMIHLGVTLVRCGE